MRIIFFLFIILIPKEAYMSGAHQYELATSKYILNLEESLYFIYSEDSDQADSPFTNKVVSRFIHAIEKSFKRLRPFDLQELNQDTLVSFFDRRGPQNEKELILKRSVLIELINFEVESLNTNVSLSLPIKRLLSVKEREKIQDTISKEVNSLLQNKDLKYREIEIETTSEKKASALVMNGIHVLKNERENFEKIQDFGLLIMS